MDVLLTDKQIRKVAGGNTKTIGLVVYPDLHKYNSIEQLFGNRDRILLLYVAEMNASDMSGHWCLLSRRKPNIVELYDSYGTLIDDELKYFKTQWRAETHQDKRFLTYLLYLFSLKAGNEIHYNEKPYQKWRNDVNTCGRWVGVRGHFYKIPLERYQTYFDELKKDGYDLDKVIVYMSDRLYGKPIIE